MIDIEIVTNYIVDTNFDLLNSMEFQKLELEDKKTILTYMLNHYEQLEDYDKCNTIKLKLQSI